MKSWSEKSVWPGSDPAMAGVSRPDEGLPRFGRAHDRRPARLEGDVDDRA
jgi:hypothetical protein